MGANKLPGNFSDHLKRVVVEPRPNWQEKVKADGLSFYDLPGVKWASASPIVDSYWTEEGALEISSVAEK